MTSKKDSAVLCIKRYYNFSSGGPPYVEQCCMCGNEIEMNPGAPTLYSEYHPSERSYVCLSCGDQLDSMLSSLVRHWHQTKREEITRDT